MLAKAAMYLALASGSTAFHALSRCSRALRHTSVSTTSPRRWYRRAPSMSSTQAVTEALDSPMTRDQHEATDPRRPRRLLRRCIQEAPDQPGVYTMESASGRKLYIGKSVKLSSRVPTYFTISSGSEHDDDGGTSSSLVMPGANLSRRIEVMTNLVERIDYIVTESGAEALLLEASMIRHHQPPFNVLLKDDKRNCEHGTQLSLLTAFCAQCSENAILAMLRRKMPARYGAPLNYEEPPPLVTTPQHPYVCVTWSEPFPRVIVTRDRPRRGGGAEDRYYGPFVDPSQVKSTLALVRKVLPLRERQRPLYKDKPCLNYDIGLCPGPCQGLISEDKYAETVRLAEMVFKGEGGELVSRLHEKMMAASHVEDFERAGEIKDQIQLVRGGLLGSALHFSTKGVVAGLASYVDSEDGGRGGLGMGDVKRDVVAVGLAGDVACFQVFRVRNGRLTGRLGFTHRVEDGLSRGEVLQACLERYWSDALLSAGAAARSPARQEPHRSSSPAGRNGRARVSNEEARGIYVVEVPDEIVTADALPAGGAAMLADLLARARQSAAGPDTAADAQTNEASGLSKTTRGRRGRRQQLQREQESSIRIVHGVKGTGERHHLCVMVSKNAELEAKRLLASSEAKTEGLAQLAQMLGLPSAPARIEGFDVSHTSGGQAVASIVSFVDGKANLKGHRRYRIRSSHVRKGHSDDYASLAEIVTRRFSPPASSSSRSSGRHDGPPDLVLIDGGKGQLGAALSGAAQAARAWGQSDQDRGSPFDKSLDLQAGVTDEIASQRADPDAILLRGEEHGQSDGSASVHVGGGRRVVFVALAKKEEEVFVPGSSEPLLAALEAGPSSPGMMILRQVRDEAHRFAIAYHRKLRGKNMFLEDAAAGSTEQSSGAGDSEAFEGIPGLSSKTREALQDTFGSLEAARTAGEAELRRIPGIGPTLAKRILS